MGICKKNNAMLCEEDKMVGYIKGNVEDITNDYVIVETNGIGYQIFTSALTTQQCSKLHNEVKLFTYLHVREDGISLFGFLTKKELETFKLLISISGIGPKAALSILSVLTVEELSFAVMSGDAKMITKANGIGVKGANRIIVELKDKLSFSDYFEQTESTNNNQESNSTVSNTVQDTVLALVSLGYSEIEALQAVRKVEGADEMSSEDLLRFALKKLF